MFTDPFNVLMCMCLIEYKKNYLHQYRVRQRGCSLTHSARTQPAVHPGIKIWVDEIELEKKKEEKKIWLGDFLGGKFFDFFLFLDEIEIEKK